MDIPDYDIVIKIQKGKEEALRTLYEKYYGILVAYVRYIIRNPMLAEDFVQDAFCVLWESRTKLNPEQPVLAYLYKLVRNRCIDFLRKNKSKNNYTRETEWKLQEMELLQTSDENHILSEITANEAQRVVQQTMETLPVQTFEIFQLSRNELLKNKEIAEKIGLSEKAVEYHITKVLVQLREALKDFL